MTEVLAHTPDLVHVGRATGPEIVFSSAVMAGIFGGVAYPFGKEIEVGVGTAGFIAGVAMSGLSSERAKNLAIEGKTIKSLLMVVRASIENAIAGSATGSAIGFSAGDLKWAFIGGTLGGAAGAALTFETFLETRKILKNGGDQLRFLNVSNEIVLPQ